MEKTKELIVPFILTGDSNRETISRMIAYILDTDEDLILQVLRSSDRNAFMGSGIIKDVKLLEDKIIALTLFTASTDIEMDFKKGKQEFLDTFVKYLKKK